MSRVIKNDDGVVVVEGTPASTLVKDSDKFFATKAPERMAGESISQPRKIDPRAINTKSPIAEKKESFLDFYKKQSSPIFDGKGNVIGFKDGSSSTTEMFDKPIPREEYKGPVSDKPTESKKPVEDKARYTGGSKDFNERTGRVEPDFRDSQKKGRRPSFESLSAEEQAEITARREETMKKREKRANTFERHGRPAGGNPNRNEAKEKAESRRKRFFERRRSKKEAERSQEEQEATQGRFITTLGR